MRNKRYPSFRTAGRHHASLSMRHHHDVSRVSVRKERVGVVVLLGCGLALAAAVIRAVIT